MAASTFASALALLTCTAGAFPVYDVSEGAALQFNAGGTSFNSLGSLSPTQAIQCFANYASGGNGTCLILGLEGAEGDKQVSLEGSEFVFNANETLEISVAAFSAERAVVCYYDAANENRVTCRFLRADGALGSRPLRADWARTSVPLCADIPLSRAESPARQRLPAFRAAPSRLWPWSWGRDARQENTRQWTAPSPVQDTWKGKLRDPSVSGHRSLSVSDDRITGASEAKVINQNATRVPYAMTRISPLAGVICWSYTGYTKEGAGVCNKLSLDGDGEITVGAEFFIDEEHTSGDFSVHAFSETSAVLCWNAEKDFGRWVTFRAPCRLRPSASVMSWHPVRRPRRRLWRASRARRGATASGGARRGVGHPARPLAAGANSRKAISPRAQEGTCTTLLLDGGNLSKTTDAVFGQATDSNFEGLVVVSLTDEEGVVCWADGTAANQLECKFLMPEAHARGVGCARAQMCRPGNRKR